MSLTALGPLERPEPLLGARNYPPSAQKLKSALDNLQSALTNVLIKFFIDRMNATHRWHETAAEIDPALSDFMEVISNYLRVFYVSEPQWRKGPVVVLNPPIKFGPTFKDLAHTPLLSSFAKTIDEAEKSLTVQDLSYAGFPNPLSSSVGKVIVVDLDQLNERLAWLAAVRTLIVLVLFRALDYRKVWDQLHGDTGVALSRVVVKLASALKAKNEFLELVSLIDGRRSFVAQSFGRPIGPLLGIAAVPRQVQDWLNEASNGEHDVGEVGLVFPFEFQPLPRDLYRRSINQDDRTPEEDLDCDVIGAGGGPGDKPLPHMFARPATTRRACWVRRYWNRVKRETLKAGAKEEDEWKFMFKINAANLQFGGQHPPHATPPVPEMGHRNGAELDIDLTHLPDLLKKGASAMQTEPVRSQGNLDGDPERESFAGDVPFIETGSTPALGQLAFAEEDWEFPDGPDKEKLTKIATAFTECIYLTFPAYIIFASSAIAFTAQANLEGRLALLAKKSTDDKEKQTFEMIGRFVHAIDTEIWRKKKPATEKNDPKQTLVLKPEDAAKEAAKRRDLIAQHRNHWHVNYGPNWLGSEPPVPTKFQSDADLRWAALKFLEEKNRWRKVLGLDPIDEEQK